MAEYARFKFDTKKLRLKESVIRIYPFVCWHLGSTRCDMTFIKQMVKRCKEDPNGYWVTLGDSGECVTKLSKGNVYKQLLSPGQQQDMVVELLEPIRKKGLFGIRGNHGNRIDKETGLGYDKTLCVALGIPYLGTCAFTNLVVNRSSYDVFWHHGTDSGSPLATKVRAAEGFARWIDADAIVTAHSHVALDLPPAALLSADNDTCAVKTKMRHGFIAGSAYDSRGDYAEEKAYTPLLPSHLVLEFDGRIVEGRAKYQIGCEIIRSDGQHKIQHDYLKYREEK